MCAFICVCVCVLCVCVCVCVCVCIHVCVCVCIHVCACVSSGQLEENDFVQTVMSLPKDPVSRILNFHILPENMRENVHRNLPEVGIKPINSQNCELCFRFLEAGNSQYSKLLPLTESVFKFKQLTLSRWFYAEL